MKLDGANFVLSITFEVVTTIVHGVMPVAFLPCASALATGLGLCG